jgi:predicted PurR-regulated permease PerM
MLGIDRRTAQVAWTLFLFILLLFVIYKIGRTLSIFALALIFAHLLAPVVGFVERIIPRRVPRVATLAIVYIALLAVLVGAMIPLVSRISQEAGALASRLPAALKGDPLSNLPIPGWLEPLRPQLTSVLRERIDELGDNVIPMLSSVSTQILSGLPALLTIVLIPILSFFFLKDGTAMREAIVESVDSRRRDLVDNIFSDLHLLLARYIRALVILALSTFVFYATFLTILGAPYPALLGGIGAILEFIPAVGPFAGSVVILLVAGFAGYSHLVWIVLFLVVYRIFLDYVLSPYLMSSGVEVHPMLVLFGVLAGEQLLGIPGMFFSVPVMAALRMILIRLRRRRRAT